MDRAKLRKMRRLLYDDDDAKLCLLEKMVMEKLTVVKEKKWRDRRNRPFVIWDEEIQDYRMLRAQQSCWYLLYVGTHSEKPVLYATFISKYTWARGNG